MTENEKEERHTREDLVNKIMVGAVIGLLGWNIYTTQQLTIDVAVLTEKIVQLEDKLKGG